MSDPRPGASQLGVGEDCLKLTTYFGERDRTESGLLGDELLDIYEERRLRASVLLRGAEGFGRLHQLRTDRLLTLSEDLPVVSIAVDRRERIEAALADVLQVKRRGLITLERARLLAGEVASAQLPEELDEATKLTVYLGRKERVGRTATFAAATALLHRHGIAGATVLLGVDGTRGGQRLRAKFFARNAEVPTMIVAVGAGGRIAKALPELGGLLREPLITLERVRVCKRDGKLLAAPHELPGTDEHGLALWQKLTIYTSQAATHDGHPLNLQIVRQLRESGAAGATSIRGIWGFHGDHTPHGDRFFQARRHVPVVTIVIDTPERIARSFALVDELTAEHGLVTSEMVPALSALSATASHGGLRLASHDY
jgi:PII-like signaling protein